MIRAKTIARELLEREDFDSLGALHTNDLVRLIWSKFEIKMRGVAPLGREMRDTLHRIRFKAAQLDPDRGNRMVLVNDRYFKLSNPQLESITEIDAREFIALNGSRAAGILFVNPSVPHHRTVLRTYRKMKVSNIKSAIESEEKATRACAPMLTAGQKRDALRFLGSFNTFKDMGRALIGSGK